MFTITKHPGRLFILFAAMLASASVLAVNPVSEGVIWERPSGIAGDAGNAVAVGEDGNVYLVGTINTVPPQVFVTKINPTTNAQVWQKFIGTGVATFDRYPVDIQLRGKSIYVCGSWDTAKGFIAKLGMDLGDVVWNIIIPNMGPVSPWYGVSKMAIDPVDGSIWAAGSTSSGPPNSAVLLHVLDNGSIVSREHITFNGQTTMGMGIGVDGDKVYLCGSGYSGGNKYPWLWGRSKLDPGDIFSRVETSLGSGMTAWSMGVSNDVVFTAVSDGGAGGIYVATFTKFGTKIGKILFPSPGISRPVSITVHPTQQIALVTGGGGQIAQAYDKNLQGMWAVTPFTTWVDNINGLAFEPGLYGNMYATGGIGTPTYIKLAKVRFNDTNGMPSDIMIAPNVIELQGLVRQAGISVKASAGANVVVDISDATGNFIRRLSAVAGSQGYANLPWDMRDRHGNIVAQGTYFVRTDAVAGLQKPIMVIKKRKR